MKKEARHALPSLLGSFAAWLSYFFLILPSLVVIPMSFGNKDEMIFPPTSPSLYLYSRYFSDPGWMQATTQSFVVAVFATVSALVLGLSAAYGLERYHFRGKQLLRVLLLSPIFVPGIVMALGFYLYLGQLRLVGTTLGLVASHTVVALPFVLISVVAGLRHVDQNIETAAMVMGASRFLVFRRVTLPLLRPSLIAGGLFAFLTSFDEVVISFFIANVHTQTLPVKMYSSILFEISPVLAAISTLMTALSLTLCLIVAYFQPRRNPGQG